MESGIREKILITQVNAEYPGGNTAEVLEKTSIRIKEQVELRKAGLAKQKAG